MLQKNAKKNDSIIISHEVAVSKAKEVTENNQRIAGILNDNSTKALENNTLLASVEDAIGKFNMPDTEKKLLATQLNKLQKGVNSTNQTLMEATKYINKIATLQDDIKVMEYEYEQLIERMEEVSELAGLGIVAETLTHELNTLVSNTKKNTDEIIEYFKKQYGSDKRMDRYFNFIKYSSDSIRKQVSHLSPGFRSVRTMKNNLRISDLLSEHIEHYSDRANRFDINLNFKISNDYEIYVSQGMIHQVFDNLYLNSEHWLQHSFNMHKIESKKYNIEVKENGIVHVWDNGIGIDPSIENQIFEPFVSNKKNGRGLGLYIVSKLLQSHTCTIRLIRERNIFNNLYKFELDFSKCLRIYL